MEAATSPAHLMDPLRGTGSAFGGQGLSMPFPFSIHGSVPIPDDVANVPDDAIILACVDQCEHEGARIVSRGSCSTAFTAPLFRSWGSNWRFTVPFSAGSFEITSDSTGRRRLRYDLSTRRIAVLGTLIVAGLFAAVAVKGLGLLPWWIPLGFWLWIVGVNYTISLVRAPSWMRRRVSDAATAVRFGSVGPQPNER
jgi:hypothetical protein